MFFKSDLSYFTNQCDCAINIKNRIYYNYILELCIEFIKEYPDNKNQFLFVLHDFLFLLSKQRKEELFTTCTFLFQNYLYYVNQVYN